MMKKVIGTSLFVIFLNRVAGLAATSSQPGHVRLETVIVSGVAVGGTILFASIEAHALQRIFVLLVLVVGVFLVAKNFTVLF